VNQKESFKKAEKPPQLLWRLSWKSEIPKARSVDQKGICELRRYPLKDFGPLDRKRKVFKEQFYRL
jgi:hypothetical protein